jgi:hypothetical protein
MMSVEEMVPVDRNDTTIGSAYAGQQLLVAIITMDAGKLNTLLFMGTQMVCNPRMYDVGMGFCPFPLFSPFGSYLLATEDTRTRQEIRRWLETSGFARPLAIIHPDWKTLFFGDKLLLNSIIRMDAEEYFALLDAKATLEREEGYFLLRFLGKERCKKIYRWLTKPHFSDEKQEHYIIARSLEIVEPNWETLLFGRKYSLVWTGTSLQ